jgi:hypothetical protein
MKTYDLNQEELFLIETLRAFRFLSGYNYEPQVIGLFQCRSEYSVTFINRLNSRSIKILWEESQELNVMFETKTFLGKKVESLKEIGLSNRPITSVKTLAELVQSDYLYLIT